MLLIRLKIFRILSRWGHVPTSWIVSIIMLLRILIIYIMTLLIESSSIFRVLLLLLIVIASILPLMILSLFVRWGIALLIRSSVFKILFFLKWRVIFSLFMVLSISHVLLTFLIAIFFVISHCRVIIIFTVWYISILLVVSIHLMSCILEFSIVSTHQVYKFCLKNDMVFILRILSKNQFEKIILLFKWFKIL